MALLRCPADNLFVPRNAQSFYGKLNGFCHKWFSLTSLKDEKVSYFFMLC